MRSLTLIAYVAASASLAAAQQTPTRTLARPDLEYGEPFSQIVGFRELSDGRVIVADSRDKTLQIINLASGQTKAIGREGSGPQEWTTLSRLFAWPGDTTVMTDVRANRLFIIGPDGTPVRTFTPAATVTAPAGVTIAGGGAVGARGADSRGRLYYQASAFSFGGVSGRGAGPAVPDSQAIIRFDPVSMKHDTIAFIRLPARGPAVTTGTAGAMVSSSAPLPFNPTDAWGVLPDGRVVIARADDYHVEIFESPSRRSAGPRVNYTPVRVGDAEKRAYLEEQRRLSAGRRMMINGQPVAAPPIPEPTEWPATMPPFGSGTAGSSALYVTPAGETWVLRSRAANDDIPALDVFNAQGQHSGRVVLPKGTTIVGFGARAVYLIRTDDDGLQYLQRYRQTADPG